MNRRLAVLAALACAFPISAMAVPVTLNFNGTFTSVVDPAAELPADVATGLNFQLTMTYDNAAAFQFGGTSTAPAAGAFSFYDGTSLSIGLVFGTTCAAANNCGDSSASGLSRIGVFDNFSINTASAPIADRLIFAMIGPDGRVWRIVFSDPTLSALSGTSLPASVSSQFTDAALQVCTPVLPANIPQFNAVAIGASCNGDTYTVTGSLTPARGNVPEPATLSLLGLGLFGAGLARRRRSVATRG